uniref:Variant surface glycoprotein 370 n=1 Tax=Trypanosoma brucei TaxID=5691 RepID=M4SZX5_9TRYP|nr:variant surface glycoprotein 370 [Trypanosoma brucei]
MNKQATGRIGLAALFLLLCASFEPVGAAEPTAPDNAEAYATICALVAIAKAPYSGPKDDITDSDIIDVIAAVNLTAGGQNVTAAAIEGLEKEYVQLDELNSAKQACTQQAWGFCKEGAKYSKNNNGNEVLLKWANRKLKKEITNQLHRLAREAVLLEDDIANADFSKDVQTVGKKLKEDLIGNEPTDSVAKTIPLGKTRAGTCSSPAGTETDNFAGASLKQDVMCLCGMHTGDNQGGLKVCAKLDSNPAVALAPDTDAQADWIKFRDHCDRVSNAVTLSKETINTALQNFIKLISQPQTTNFDKAFFPGKINGTGNTGCDGDGADTNNGRCIQYKKAYTKAAGTTIPWMVALREAAEAMDSVQKKANRRHTISMRLRSLKQALQTLAADPDETTATQSATKPHKTAPSAKACRQNTTNETCTENKCKWDGNTKDKGTCKVDESKDTTQTNAGEAGEKTTGCAAHFNDKNACEKMNEGKEKHVCECKKDGEGDKDKDELRCQNSSVLVNKKMALIASYFMYLV